MVSAANYMTTQETREYIQADLGLKWTTNHAFVSWRRRWGLSPCAARRYKTAEVDKAISRCRKGVPAK